MARESTRALVVDTLRRATIGVGKRVPFVLNAARATVIAARRARFERMREKTSLRADAVVFQAYGGRGYSCSPAALYRAMRGDERFAGHELTWSLTAPVAAALAARGGYDVRGLEGVAPTAAEGIDLDRDFGTEALEELRAAVIVIHESPAHYRALAQAGTWITNSLLPDHVRPAPGQVYIQAWHGTPLKRLGNDITTDNHATYSRSALHRRYRREGERLTLLLAQSRFAAERFVSAFDLGRLGKADAVAVTGYPRNDDLVGITGERAAALKRRFGLPDDKRVVLYAPTWRDDEHAGETFVDRGRVDFEALREALGEEYVIAFRAHYLTAAAIDFGRYRGFLFDVSSVNDINDIYAVSDVLVTDYSSVFFDFANLGRPIVFHMYDLDRYATEIRGFYLDVNELPGPITRTDQQLAEAIRGAARPSAADSQRLLSFRERFCPLDDGKAAARVLDRILSLRP